MLCFLTMWKKTMGKKTMGKSKLEKLTQGHKVLAVVHGKFSFDKRTNLYKTIKSLGYTVEDIPSKIDIIIGGRRQWESMGYHMAIVEVNS